MSLLSQTLFIASINITDDLIRGNWSLTVRSQGLYSVQVLGVSNETVSSEIYEVDNSSIYGYVNINGKPLQGK